jgi:NTP pyrophosphatase (non-canonical NTP hydrolase)
MPQPLTFSQRNRQRCEAPNGFNHPLESWSLSDWLTATAGELGEAANVIKKLNRIRDGVTGNSSSETAQQLRQDLADELADTYIYLDLLAQAAGFDLDEITESKFEKTSRKIGYTAAAPAPAPEGCCQLCGVSMLPEESMFLYHGYSESCDQAAARVAAAT